MMWERDKVDSTKFQDMLTLMFSIPLMVGDFKPEGGTLQSMVGVFS